MKYEEPIIEIIELKVQDVICDSGFGGNLEVGDGDDDSGWE